MSELLAKPEASDVELAPTTRSREVVIPGVPANLKAGRVSGWMMFGVLCPPWPAAGRAAQLPRWAGVKSAKRVRKVVETLKRPTFRTLL